MRKDLIKIFCVLAIVFVGFVSVVARGGTAISGILKTSELTDFMSGSLSGKIDKAVFQAIPKSSGLNGLVAGLLYAGLHDAGPQVWAGCNDWLYTEEELRSDRHEAQNILFHAKILNLLLRTFSDRDILLIILPIPDKAEQVGDRLCGIAADQSRFRNSMWADATGSMPMNQIDLRSRWPSPGYWRTDTHWNSEGARFAAVATARFINAKLGTGTERINLTMGPKHKRVGDLARLAGLTDAPRWLAPAFEYEEETKLDIAKPGGLLDAVATPSIILAGSSYSQNSGFIEYLQNCLSREVAQLSLAGGGFSGAMLDIIQQKPAVLANVKAVIWEWPMRSLTLPPTEAEHQFIRQSSND